MKVQETVVKTRNGREVIKEHPAMGVVQIVRQQTTGVHLFGSDIVHHTCIHVTVKRATVNRHNMRDRIRGEESVVEFSMSADQWARMVASIGIGEGTPVTLDRAPEPGTPVVRMPDFEIESVRDTFAKEIGDVAKEASQKIQSVQERLKEFLQPGAKVPSKSVLHDLFDDLRLAGQHFESNMVHIAECFQEIMEESTQAAKTEVESFAAGVAQQTGLDALRNGVTALPNKVE